MIELKPNGSGLNQPPPPPPVEVSPSNLAFAEELYYQFFWPPLWRRPGPPPPPGRRGAGPPLRPRRGRAGAWPCPPAATSLPPRARPPTAPPASGAPPARPRPNVQRLVEAYRELGHLSADLDPLGLVKRGGDHLAPRELRAVRRGSGFGVQQRERRRVPIAPPCATWSSCCARPIAATSASSWRTCTTSSCAAGCRTAWSARATAWL